MKISFINRIFKTIKLLLFSFISLPPVCAILVCGLLHERILKKILTRSLKTMQIFSQTFLLFALNLLDAVLTLYWVRNGFATEGNGLMARLLDIGDFPFLAVKIIVGAAAAFVLWNWGNKRIARYGLTLTLVIYIGLMGVHLFTGLSVFGLVSETFIQDASLWSQNLFAVFI